MKRSPVLILGIIVMVACAGVSVAWMLDNTPNANKYLVFVQVDDSSTLRTGNFTVFVTVSSGWVSQSFQFECEYGSWETEYSERVFLDREPMHILVSFSDIDPFVERSFILNEYTTSMDGGWGYGIKETVLYRDGTVLSALAERVVWYG